MNNIINNFFIITFCIFLFSGLTVLAETPEEMGLRLAIEGDLRDEGFQDTVSQMTMKLRNAQGEESIRKFYSKTLEERRVEAVTQTYPTYLAFAEKEYLPECG